MRNNWSSALAEYTAALQFSEYVTDGGMETERETLHFEERERGGGDGGGGCLPYTHSCEA